MDDSPNQSPRWGDRLAEAHAALRGIIAPARAALPPTPVPSLTEQLRNHCQTVCAYLHGHHTSEDDALFPHLAEARPALDRLRREHVVVDRILTELDTLAHTEDTRQIRSTLDRLTAELEEHFAFEEKHLVPALNALTGPVPWETRTHERRAGRRDRPTHPSRPGRRLVVRLPSQLGLAVAAVQL